ncbi:hypothetical protein Hanom_Chr09g00806311 [Helianthus anomalus]
MVDLITLSRSPYIDDKPGGCGYLFFESLQREVLVIFLLCILLNLLLLRLLRELGIRTPTNE